jgi:hypothetical protein
VGLGRERERERVEERERERGGERGGERGRESAREKESGRERDRERPDRGGLRCFSSVILNCVATVVACPTPSFEFCSAGLSRPLLNNAALKLPRTFPFFYFYLFVASLKLPGTFPFT